MSRPKNDLKPTAESTEGWEARLGRLREQIDSIDGRLVELLAERGRAVAAVAAVKRDHNLPVYHPAREEDLISRRRAQAQGAGVNPDLAEDLFRRIVRESRVSQSSSLADHGVKAEAKVLIVGGRGSMGRFLSRWFAGAGYEVRVLDKEDWPRAGALCDGIDLAILSVPIDATEATAARIGPHLPPDCVLADITSLKVGPLRAMLAAHP